MNPADPEQPKQPAELEPPDTERPASMAPTEEQLETESPGGHDVRGHDPYAALRFRDYRMYSAGWMVSVIGRQVQDLAVGFELYHRTNSKLALGWVGLAQAIPLVGAPTGSTVARSSSSASSCGPRRRRGWRSCRTRRGRFR